MRGLISMACGGRPRITALAVRTLEFQPPEWDIGVVVWDGETDPYNFGSRRDMRILYRPGGSKATCAMASLAAWRRDHDGEWPDYWAVVDDDALLDTEVLIDAVVVMEAEPRLGFAGLANKASHFTGARQIIGGYPVQIGRDFCTGGGAGLWRRESLEQIGGYQAPERRRNDDHLTVTAMHTHGWLVGLLLHQWVSLLNDEGMYPENRLRIVEMEMQDRRENGMDDQYSMRWLESWASRLREAIGVP